MTDRSIVPIRRMALLSVLALSLFLVSDPVFAQWNPLDPYCVAQGGGNICYCSTYPPCTGGTVPGTSIYMEWVGYSCPAGGTPTYHLKYWNAANTFCSGSNCANPDVVVGSINWTTNVYYLPFPDDGEIWYWQPGAQCPGSSTVWGRTAWFRNGPSAPPALPALVSPLPDLTLVDSPSIQFTWQIASRSTRERIRAVSDACSGGPPSTTYLDYESYFWDTSFCNPVLYPLGNCTRFGSFSDIGQTIRWYASGRNDLGIYGTESTSRVVNGTVPPAAPLNEPHDGTGTGTPGTSIRFVWDPSAKTVNYKLMVARDPGFSNIFKQVTTTSQQADVPGFVDDGTQYWWKVVPHNCAGDATVGSRTLTNKILTCTAGVGTGTGQAYPYSQNHIDTCYVSSNAQPNWYLYDISRRGAGKMPASSAIETRKYYSTTLSETIGDIRPSSSSPGDNVWGDSSQASSVDAHVNAGLFYDYLNSTHTLNSFDNNGASMVSLVDLPTFPGPIPNAYWDDGKSRVFYSISSGAPTTYSASADMVGHVWGDAVTDRASTNRGMVPIPWQGRSTKGLVPAWESGALRIAFADWIGTAFEAGRAGDPNHVANWTIGDPSIIIRDLQNPPAYGQPDTYHGPGYLDLNQGNCLPGTNDPTINQDCGASVNSGVPNKMFYLLVAGGTHNNVAVQGIGLKKAMTLALKANRTQWLNNVTFSNAKDGMVLAAASSNEADQTRNAWAAVGVGTIPSISVSAAPPEGGTLTGGGSYSFGASATVTATANSGFQFVNWTENGTQVSTSSSYNFTVNGSRSLVATFAVYAPKISVTPTAFDFGTYSVGQSSPPQTFTVKNMGSGPLHVGSVSNGGLNPSDFIVTSDNCSLQTLSLNGTCTLQVKFAPLASGPMGASLIIPSDDPDTPMFSVSLTGAVLTVQTILVELPNADAGPNQGSPTPAVAHYLNVDDDPHDGDTTMLTFSSGGFKEVFTTADQLLDSDVITSLKVRWAAKRGSGADWSGMAGLVFAGQEYYGPVVQLASSYLVREESFPRNPSTNQPWSVQDVRSAKLIYQQVTTTAELPRASLSEIVLEVTLQRMPTITVTASPAVGGGVSGGGMYPFGTPVIVTATANSGYVFVNWTESGVVVSTSASYAFTAGGNRALVANFVLYVSDIQVDPVAIDFGSVSVGESSAVRYVTVTNQAYAPLTIGTVSITGANPYDFGVIADTCSGQTLPTSNSCSLQVVFTPKSTGARTGTLSIPSNDPDTPLLGVPLTGSATTIVYNLVELPNGDAGPNQGGPTPSGAHYLNVDDEPNDGDTTLLSFTSGGYKEVYTIADQLHDTDVITGVKVRWAAKKGSGSDWTAMAGLVVGGQEYYGPTVNLPANYTVREETFANNPATGQPWTVQDVRAAKLIYQQVTITTELPRARLSEIVLVVSARRTPMSTSLTELPNADAGPNQGSPTPSVAHYLNVDDEPNDGDTTLLSFSSGGYKEVYTFADQLLNTDLVTSVKVRWVAKKGSGSDWQAKAGLVVGGQEYYGATVQLPTNYTVREETFATNPATGQPWTVQDVRAAKLIYQQVTITTQLPKARLTEIVLVVSVQRMPVLATVTERPNSDASPNDGAPSPVVAHYLNVDDEPNDGDSTVITFAGPGKKEVYTTVDQLLDTDHVQVVKVRWVAKKGAGSDWQAKAGLVVGGQEYYGAAVQLPTNYTVREETFANNPATGQPWTVADVRAAKLIYQQVTFTMQLPKAKLTELVLIVTVERAP